MLLCSCGSEDAPVISVADIPEGSIPEDISSADLGEMDFEFTERDKEGTYDSADVVSGNDNGDVYQITAAGTYILSGDYTDKIITVEAGENDKIQIVLDNANIINSKGPAVYIKSADKVFITLKEGTSNTISDGSDYELIENESTIDGAIFSRADLTINGSGSLTVNGNLKHGIVSKDDLVITGGSITVSSENVGLNGKDCVKISSATVNITAGSDGIRSDNAEDAAKGYVYIESGTITIDAANDGIQAETAIRIDDCAMTVTAGSGSGSSLSSSSESYKGIKASSDIIINGGSFIVDSQDDCIHSNNTICIINGKFDLTSGDDGIHADTDLSISGGDILIRKSYEGIEASRIFITGGKIDLTASDDGLNAAGGADGSSTGGRPGMGGFSNGVGEIVISGGYTFIDASGDGIDSNSTIAVSGGVVLVSGPTNSGNASFDYDGSAAVTGGVLVALGSSGMAQSFSQAENQGAMLVNFSGSTNQIFALCDTNGNVIASFKPEKNYQSVVVTAPEIQQGNTYKIVIGAEVEGVDENGFARNTSYSGGTELGEIQMDSLLYGYSGGMGMPGGDHGGGMGGGTPPGGFGGGRR